MVPVAIPDSQFVRQSREQSRAVLHHQFGPAIFPAVRALDAPAQDVRHPLQPVANAQHRQRPWTARRGRKAARRRHTRNSVRLREQCPYRLELADLFDACRARQNRAEYLLLADSPGDQLRVLPAEIKHYDAAALTHRFFFPRDFILKFQCYPAPFPPV